ncbi:type II toxin-antitoxin system HicB family antitoxin [Azotobacter chroococcum]|uniref:type II toxin-antitoxin system HicB family antitoxin n=1 Tax=Azotobacter chroococcum TaxID=353 RepID=UPI00103E2F3E|nr:type II toxin-antitoxin system HicB family antitoxin [Azotobacter chroococcum]TBW35015.1 type II toxin-antitoxin system HicB family antitoxin [Azotobacter chroococcum]
MKDLLQYKGYYGSIEASTEDNCLLGKLLFIRALVNYEGQTVAELQAAFREAVDDYLETCKAQGKGKEPEIPCKGSFNVRVGHELHLAASLAANRRCITLNDLTRQALSDYLEQHA